MRYGCDFVFMWSSVHGFGRDRVSLLNCMFFELKWERTCDPKHLCTKTIIPPSVTALLCFSTVQSIITFRHQFIFLWTCKNILMHPCTDGIGVAFVTRSMSNLIVLSQTWSSDVMYNMTHLSYYYCWEVRSLLWIVIKMFNIYTINKSRHIKYV